MTKLPALAVAAMLALPLTACGSGGGASSDDARASTSIANLLMRQQKDATAAAQLFAFQRKDAECIGHGLVSHIGTERLQKYGLLSKDMKAKGSVNNVAMSAKDAAAATDTLFSCSDVESMMRTAVSRAGSVPKPVRTCVRKALTDEALRPVFRKVFEGDAAAAQTALTAPMMRCLPAGKG